MNNNQDQQEQESVGPNDWVFDPALDPFTAMTPYSQYGIFPQSAGQSDNRFQQDLTSHRSLQSIPAGAFSGVNPLPWGGNNADYFRNPMPGPPTGIQHSVPSAYVVDGPNNSLSDMSSAQRSSPAAAYGGGGPRSESTAISTASPSVEPSLTRKELDDTKAGSYLKSCIPCSKSKRQCWGGNAKEGTSCYQCTLQARQCEFGYRRKYPQRERNVPPNTRTSGKACTSCFVKKIKCEGGNAEAGTSCDGCSCNSIQCEWLPATVKVPVRVETLADRLRMT